MAKPCKLDDLETRAAFLLAYERSGEVAPAAAAVGIARSTVYDQLERDPTFREECEAAVGRLLDEAFKTLKEVAVKGQVEKFYDKDGNLIREKYTVDSRLLERLIQRHLREWNHKLEVEKTVSGRVTHEHKGKVDVSSIPVHDRDSLFDIVTRNGLASPPSEN